MFSVHSYRSLQGQKLLRAFMLIRGRRKTCSNLNTLQHSWVDTHYPQMPFQVHFSSASRGTTRKIEKLTKLITEISTEGGIQDRDNDLPDDQHCFDDISLPETVGFPWKNKLKRFNRQLNECIGTLQEAQKLNTSVPVEKLLPKFPRIVAFSMNQSVPFALREKCLRLLLMQDADNELTKKLLTRTLEESQQLPMDVLVNIIQKISASEPTELRMKVRKDFVAHIVNKRFHEIGQKHLLSVMYQLDELYDMKTLTHEMRAIYRTVKTDASENVQYFENDNTSLDAKVNVASIPVWSANLERRILDIVDEIKTKDLVRILTLMGKWKNRNQTLLTAVIHRLCLADLSDLHNVQLTGVLFACFSLTLHDRILLDKITTLLLSRLPLSPALTTSVLAYLSHLRWYNPQLVSRCLTYSGEHVSELTAKESCSLLMSLANLYALPASEEHKSVITGLGNQALSSNLSDVDTVNVVWSLAILQSLTNDQAGLVLETSFVKRFHDTSRFQNRSCLQKLQQISTAAKIELSSYNGSYYAADADIPMDAHSNKGISKSEQELKFTLANALSKFLNMSTHVKGGERLEGGYRADAIVCAEADGSLKPVSDLEEKLEDSPKRLYSLAIKVIPFKGVIHPHKKPAGVYQMESRHLKAMGYTLVPVLYSDLHKNKSNLEHVKAIQERIKESMQSA